MFAWVDAGWGDLAPLFGLGRSFLASGLAPLAATLEPFWDPGLLVEDLAWWRFATGLAFLGFASVSDILWRRVTNRTWVLMAAVAALLLLMDLTRGEPALLYLVLVPLFVLGAYLLWYAHLLYGGADAKALMVIALLLPFPLQLGDGLPLAGTIFPGFVTVLVDSLLIFLLIPLFYFLVNLVRGHVSLPAMFLARRMPLAEAIEAKVWIMDRIERPAGDTEGRAVATVELPEAPGATPADGAGPTGDEPGGDERSVAEAVPSGRSAHLRIVLDYLPTREVEYDEKVQELADAGVEEVWATPKVPFMIPLFLGFLAAHLVGDILPWFLLQLR